MLDGVFGVIQGAAEEAEDPYILYVLGFCIMYNMCKNKANADSKHTKKRCFTTVFIHSGRFQEVEICLNNSTRCSSYVAVKLVMVLIN